MTTRRCLVFLGALLLATPAVGETTATLSLDGLSFISFEGYEELYFPSGSQLTLHVQDPGGASSTSFTIQPADVSIPEVPLWSSSGTIQYSLDEPVTGTATKTATGVKLSFVATVNALLIQEGNTGTMSYTLAFTTESTSASNAAGTNTVSLTGMRMIEGPNHVQLAATVTNKTSAFPEPGTVVYSILSGQFDQFPQLQ